MKGPTQNEEKSYESKVSGPSGKKKGVDAEAGQGRRLRRRAVRGKEGVRPTVERRGPKGGTTSKKTED